MMHGQPIIKIEHGCYKRFLFFNWNWVSRESEFLPDSDHFVLIRVGFVELNSDVNVALGS